MTLPLVSQRNDVWETRAEIPYWWRVTSSGYCFWLVVPLVKFASTNQKQYPDLGSDNSSVLNFCARLSDVISRLNRWWRREMSAVFLGSWLSQSCCGLWWWAGLGLNFWTCSWFLSPPFETFLHWHKGFLNKSTWIIFFKHCYRYSIKRATNKENNSWRRFEIES